MEYFQLTVTRGTNTGSPTTIHQNKDLGPGLYKNVDRVVASSRDLPASSLCSLDKKVFLPELSFFTE